jgi:hypothetical protein
MSRACLGKMRPLCSCAYVQQVEVKRSFVLPGSVCCPDGSLEGVSVEHGVIDEGLICRHAWGHVFIVAAVDRQTRVVREPPNLTRCDNQSNRFKTSAQSQSDIYIEWVYCACMIRYLVGDLRGDAVEEWLVTRVEAASELPFLPDHDAELVSNVIEIIPVNENERTVLFPS